MRKVFKTIILILVLTLSFGVCSYADNAGGSGTGNEEGGGSGSQTVQNGVSYRKSGFTFSIVDNNGNIVAEPSARVTFDKFPDSSHKYFIYTRYGNKRVTKLDGSMQALSTWWGKPAFNENGSGNGSYIKNWMLSKTNGEYNSLLFIKEIWGETTAQAFVDNDYYLIVEPFIFGGLHRGNKYLGNVIGSSIGWVEVRKMFGCTQDGLETRYTLNNLPNSMAYDIPVLNTPAPISLSGKQTYNDIKQMGYGVIAIWSSEIKEEPTPPTPSVSTQNADSIKAKELNYIYQNFSGSRSDSKAGFTVEKIDMNEYRAHASDHNSYIDDYSVVENKSGDLWSFKGDNVLMYRPATGLWKESGVAKNFGKNEITYPQYSYNISRQLWNDDLVLCNFKKAKINGGLSEEAIRDYAKSQLGIESDNTGKVTEVSAGLGVENTYGVSKTDSYSFKAKTKEYWEEYEVVGSHIENEGTIYEQEIEDYDYVDYSADIESGDISYSVNHYLDKYKVKPTDVIQNKMIQTIAYRHNIIGSKAFNKASLILQGNAQLKVYPEVKMTMYYLDNNTTYYDNAKTLELYVMGEQARKSNPTVICHYSAGFTSGMNLIGKTLLDSPMTGTNAFEWEKKWADDGNFQDHYGVCAQGSGFELATENHPCVKLTTISLDVLENVNGQAVRAAWGNTYNPKKVHDAYVEAMKNSLDFSVEMKRFSNNTTQFGDTDNMSFDISDTKQTYLGTDQLALIYENGAIKNRNEVVSFIASKCGVSSEEAEQILSNSGLEQQLDDMFVSNTDADNKSSNKWYDENSITLCLTSHQTNLVYGQIMLSDKNDFGTSTSQDEYDVTKNGTSGVQARFYFSLFFNSDVLSFEGYNFDVSSLKFLIDQSEIKGTRFLISNATTNDWLY